MKILYIISDEKRMYYKLDKFIYMLEEYMIQYTRYGDTITVNDNEYIFKVDTDIEEIRGMRFNHVIVDEFTR